MFTLIKNINLNEECLQLKKDGDIYLTFKYIDLNKREIDLIEDIWNKSNYNDMYKPTSSLHLDSKNKLSVIHHGFCKEKPAIIPYIKMETLIELKEKYPTELKNLLIRIDEPIIINTIS